MESYIQYYSLASITPVPRAIDTSLHPAVVTREESDLLNRGYNILNSIARDSLDYGKLSEDQYEVINGIRILKTSGTNNDCSIFSSIQARSTLGYYYRVREGKDSSNLINLTGREVEGCNVERHGRFKDIQPMIDNNRDNGYNTVCVVIIDNKYQLGDYYINPNFQYGIMILSQHNYHFSTIVGDLDNIVFLTTDLVIFISKIIQSNIASQ